MLELFIFIFLANAIFDINGEEEEENEDNNIEN